MTLTEYIVTLTEYIVTLTEYIVTLTEYTVTLTKYLVTLTKYIVTLTDCRIQMTQTRIQFVTHTWHKRLEPYQNTSDEFLSPCLHPFPKLSAHYIECLVILWSTTECVNKKKHTTLKISPCSVWTKKKNIDLVLWAAPHTIIIPRSGSSKSFCENKE